MHTPHLVAARHVDVGLEGPPLQVAECVVGDGGEGHVLLLEAAEMAEVGELHVAPHEPPAHGRDVLDEVFQAGQARLPIELQPRPHVIVYDNGIVPLVPEVRLQGVGLQYLAVVSQRCGEGHDAYCLLYHIHRFFAICFLYS